MRILITTVGDQELRSLSNPKSSSGRLNYKKAAHTRNHSHSKAIIHQNHHTYQSTNNIIPKKNHKKIETIYLKNSKLPYIPKLSKLYEEISENDPGYTPIIEDSSTLPTMNSYKEKHHQTTYSISDIISPPTLNKMFENIAEEKKYKEKHTVINSSNFRSVYEIKDEIQKAKELLTETSISPDRSDIIRYLNKKKNFNMVLAKNLKEANEGKLDKVNKVCKLLLTTNIDESNVIQQDIKRKQIKKTRDIKESFKKKIDKMKTQIENSNEIFRSYVKHDNKYEKYKEQLYEIQEHHWKKYDIQRLMHKSREPSSRNVNDKLSNYYSII